MQINFQRVKKKKESYASITAQEKDIR